MKILPKNISLTIKKLRKSLGLTQHALAQKLGVRLWAVSSWEQGRWEPSGEHYVHLARLAPPADAPLFLNKIGIGPEMLRVLHPEPAVQVPEIRIFTTGEWRSGTQDHLRFQTQLPVLRDEAAAGSPREINERDIDSFIAVPLKFLPRGPGAYTGIYVRGDSMAPILRDRFVVVVDHHNRNPAHLRGRMVAALVGDGVLVKWLARESQPDRIILRSENPSYEDIVISSPETDPIIGDVIFWWGVQRAAGSDRR